MSNILKVHGENIISRYAWLLEQRKTSIESKMCILQHPEQSARSGINLEQIARSVEQDAECLEDIIDEFLAGADSQFIGPALQELKENYVDPYKKEDS